MKKASTVILIVVVCVVFAVLLVGLGRGAVSVLSQMEQIFGSITTEQASSPIGVERPNESESGLVDTSSKPVETEPELLPLYDIKIDFDNVALTMLVSDTAFNRREWGQKEEEDELDGALMKRNKEVAEHLGLQIRYEFIPDDSGDYYDTVFKDITLDRNQYNILINDSSVLSAIACRGGLANMFDGDMFPYLDFENPAWNSSAVNNLSFSGRFYFATGFLNTTLLDNTSIMYVNTTLYSKYKDKSDPENIQKYAIEGKWTYERMYKMIKAFDGAMVEKESLIIDFSRGEGNILRSFAAAFDVDIMKCHSNYNYQLTQNTRAENVISYTNELYDTSGVRKETIGSSAVNANENAFVTGNALLLQTRFYENSEANMAVREMEDRYGLMLMPKYDDTQEQYKTLSEGGSFVGIVAHYSEGNFCSKAISAYLQWTAEKSYIDVIGYYFNRVVKPIYFGTDDQVGTVTDSINVFDILIDNIEIEFCNVYSGQLSNIASIWTEAQSAQKTLEEIYRSKQEIYDESLRSLNAWFETAKNGG